jgi:hypothetical protein
MRNENAKVYAVTENDELRQKLRKISALFEGATTAGARDARRQSTGCGGHRLPQSRLKSRQERTSSSSISRTGEFPVNFGADEGPDANRRRLTNRGKPYAS